MVSNLLSETVQALPRAQGCHCRTLGVRVALGEGGSGEQRLDVQAGLSPRKGRGMGLQGGEGREARAGSWARSAWESKNPKWELGLPGPRGDHLSRKEAAAISFEF